jgi:hypothetical protein
MLLGTTRTKWWFLLLCVVTVALAGVAPAISCDKVPQVHGASVHEEALVNGLYIVEFDRDGDGRPDFAMLYQIVESSRDGGETQTLPHPLFYWVDTNKSGRYSETWIDQEGNGQCKDLVQYWAGTN